MRKTKCEQVAAMEASPYPDDMPYEAARFEDEGRAMTISLAPRCSDRDCEVCFG